MCCKSKTFQLFSFLNLAIYHKSFTRMMYFWLQMVLSYFTFAILFAFFIALIYKWRFLQLESLNSKWLVFGFSIKFLMGIGLWFIYTYYYTYRTAADIYKYYDDAIIIFDLTKENWLLRFQFLSGFVFQDENYHAVLDQTQHWYRNVSEPFNDNPVIIRLNLFILLFSNGLFHIHTLIFSFLSFLGSAALFKFIKQFSAISPKVLFAILFLIPSIIFWNSGVLKEAWLFFCLGFFLLFFQNLMQQFKMTHLFAFVVFAFLLFHIKTYILVGLIPGLLFLRLNFLFNWKNKILAFLILNIGIAILFLSNYHQKVFEIISQKRNDFIQLAIDSNARSLVDTSTYHTYKAMLMDLPNAFFTTLFRPGIWEVSGVFTFISSLENVILLGILLLPIFYFRKPNPKALTLVLFSLTFVFILGIVIGLTTPVLGAIVRYKIPILPFYLISVLTFVDFKRIPYIQKII